jgi:hypothetical protein
MPFSLMLPTAQHNTFAAPQRRQNNRVLANEANFQARKAQALLPPRSSSLPLREYHLLSSPSAGLVCDEASQT